MAANQNQKGHFDPPPPLHGPPHPLELSLQKVLYATQMQMSAIGWLQKIAVQMLLQGIALICFMFQILVCSIHSYFTFVCMVL